MPIEAEIFLETQMSEAADKSINLEQTIQRLDCEH